MMNKTIEHIEKISTRAMKSEPFVSVLTPVYNGADYLRECIESVLGQDYENWEYVLVNNQSTDGSLQIMEEYAAKDKRFRIHNNEKFLPQMENLNHAFRQISSESKYCKVVHADDLLFPECLSRMVKLAEENNTIGIVSSYQINGQKAAAGAVTYPHHLISGKEFGKSYLLNEVKCVAHPSALLIRSDLIRKRQKVYDETNLSDAIAFLDILNESDFGFVHQILTVIRLHENSFTNTIVKLYVHMLDLLRMYSRYAPIFLSEKQAKRVIKKRERIFYILFARSLIFDDTRSVYNNITEELRNTDYQLKYGKLLKYLIREVLLQPIKKMGII